MTKGLASRTKWIWPKSFPIIGLLLASLILVSCGEARPQRADGFRGEGRLKSKLIRHVTAFGEGDVRIVLLKDTITGDCWMKDKDTNAPFTPVDKGLCE